MTGPWESSAISLLTKKTLPQDAAAFFDVQQTQQMPACFRTAGTLDSQPRAMMCTPWQ